MHHTQTCTKAEFVWLYTQPYSYITYVHPRHTNTLTHAPTHRHTYTHSHTHTHTHIHTQRPNKYIYFYTYIYIYTIRKLLCVDYNRFNVCKHFVRSDTK